MAEAPDPDEYAKKTFYITMLGTVIYVAVVVVWIFL